MKILHPCTVAKGDTKFTKNKLQISDFNREIEDFRDLLRYYTAFFLDFLVLEGGTDMLCRKVGKELPLYFNIVLYAA